MASFVMLLSTSGLSSNLLGLAVLPVAKVLIMCSLGLLLATPWINILTSDNRKILSKLVFALFLPCLIFTELGEAISIENIKSWWFIPVNVVCGSVLGCLFGYLVALIIRPPKEFFKFTIVMIGIGNIGNIPLVLIDAICRDETNPFGTDCSTNGVAYISFGQWVGALIAYTFVFHMLAPPNIPQEEFLILGPKTLNSRNSVVGLNELPYEELHLTNSSSPEPTQTTPLLGNRFVTSASLGKPLSTLAKPLSNLGKPPSNPGKPPSNPGKPLSNPGKPLSNLGESSSSSVQVVSEMEKLHSVLPPNELHGYDQPSVQSLWDKFFDSLYWFYREARIKDIFQPPVTATILAIVLGCVPSLRNITFEDGSFFKFLVESLTIMGEAMIPCIMLTLGGNLVGGPGASELGLRTTVAITVARLFITPIMGIAVVTAAERFSLFPTTDLMLKFVLLLQHSMPSSILAGAMANLRGFAAKEATAVLFWEHIFAVFTMAFWLFIYFNYLL